MKNKVKGTYTFKELMLYEVYKGKKLNILRRFIAKHINPSTNAVYLIRKYQSVASIYNAIKNLHVAVHLLERFN